MIIQPQRYFPWKIARQHFARHFVYVLVTLVITGFSIRYYVFSTFSRTEDISLALARFDTYLTELFLTVLAVSAIYLFVTTRHYVQPLGRLIQRARQLRRLESVAELDEVDPEALNEEPGEWYDLERALNRIHKELRSKTIALSRESEELSALIGAVNEAIFAVDREENPLFFNSQFALFFPVAAGGAEALSLGETFRVPEILQAYREVLSQGALKVVTTSLHTSRHSMPRQFAVSIAPLKGGESQTVFGAIGIFHDITELKQADQIRIEFVANASHELRTPLTSIKGYLETVREDVKVGRHEDAVKFLDIIARNVDRMVSLVSDLLDLSTLDSGAQLKTSEVSAQEVTDSVLRQLETKRAAKRQEIKVHYSTNKVHADARRVEQVLLNLVHNAIKYVPDDHRIDIFWEHIGQSTFLRVKDNGPGIPVEHQGRLFERFYRVDPGRSRDAGGTGLGLAIVKHIMLKHGGSVRLQSKPGEGAEFICHFPD